MAQGSSNFSAAESQKPLRVAHNSHYLFHEAASSSMSCARNFEFGFSKILHFKFGIKNLKDARKILKRRLRLIEVSLLRSAALKNVIFNLPKP